MAPLVRSDSVSRRFEWVGAWVGIDSQRDRQFRPRLDAADNADVMNGQRRTTLQPLR